MCVCGRALVHVLCPHVCLPSLCLPLSFVFQASSISPKLVSFPAGRAMDIDSRTAKRMAQVRDIEQKSYYRPGFVEEPDPSAQTCSTRMWKYKVRVWVETMKKTQTCDRGLPHPRVAAVTTDSSEVS